MTTTPTSTTEAETLEELLQDHLDASGDISISNSGEVVRDYNSGIQRTVATDIGAFLDSTLRKKNQVNTILDSAEALVVPISIPGDRTFNNFSDIYTKIQAPLTKTNFKTVPPPTGLYPGTNPDDPDHPIHYLLNEYFALQGNPPVGRDVTNIALSSDKLNIVYTAGGTNQTVSIIDMCEYLYLSRKIEIGNLSQVAAKCLRAQQRAERMAEKEQRRNGSITGIPENPSTLPGSTTNTTNILNEELSIPQLYAACEQAKKKPELGSAYSFDKKWFFVRYTPATLSWTAQYQKSDGTTADVTKGSIGEIVAEISVLAKKKEAQKNTADTVDMGNEFSQSAFLTLCEDISKSKTKRGVYKLGGKEYIVTEITAAVVGGPPATYNAQYLGHTNTISSHTGWAPTLSQYLKDHIHFHAHTEGHHVFSKKGFIDLCEHLEHAPDRRGFYEFEGHQYPVWMESRKLLGDSYHAEIPGEGGRTNEVSAGSPEKLYEKILKKAHKHHSEHADDKKTESKEKSEEKGHEKKGDHKNDHGHDTHEHHEEGGTKYDRVVNTIFGNGLIGKAFKGARNMVPKGIRGLSGAAFDGAVASGIVGGLTYGTGIALGSAAIGTLVVPAMTTVFAGYGIYSAIKRFNAWRASKGGGDSHGGGHGGGH